jgi:hypothetical protein
MNDSAADLGEQLHRAAAEHHGAARQQEPARIAPVDRMASEKPHGEQPQLDDVAQQLHQGAATQGGQPRPTPLPAPTVHFTELREAPADSPLYREWNTYRREVGRLLAEGGEGRYVLIKEEQVIGLWETHDAAMSAGYQRFPGQPFLVHPVQEREPVWRCTSICQCPNGRLASHQAN